VFVVFCVFVFLTLFFFLITSDTSATLQELVGNLSGYLGVLKDHKVLDEITVRGIGAMSDVASGQLVRAALVQRIHAELVSVKNLSVQVTCIIRYIANIDFDHVALVQLVATMKVFTVGIAQLMDLVYTLRHLDGEVFGKSNSSGSSSSSSGEQQQQQQLLGPPVWEDTSPLIDDLPQNQSGVACGSVNQLIVKLTSANGYDSKFANTFVSTFRSFMTPRQFLDKLEERANVPENNSSSSSSENSVAVVVPNTNQTITITDEERVQVLLKVGIVIKYWVDQAIEDFDDAMVAQLDALIAVFDRFPSTAKMADSLFHFLSEKIESTKAERLLWFTREVTRVSILEEGISLPDLLIEMPSDLIAKQMTLIEWEMYIKVKATELVSQSWNKDELKFRAPNVVALIARSTRISYWVATMILGQSDVTYRARMFEKMIEIAGLLRDMNNFNTLSTFFFFLRSFFSV
jgi:RasGEF domain/RasGEF N-terminal motif